MPIDRERLLALDIPERRFAYDERDTMLYALGIGFGSDPIDEDELRFVHEQDLHAAPTLATVIGWDRSWVPASGIDWPKVVHGDQRLIVHRPLAAAGSVVSRARVTEVAEKTSGSLVRVETRLHDASTGEAICTSSTGFFVRGGFSGVAAAKGPKPHQLPERAADVVLDAPTHRNQALLYRLSGDRNPQHAVPAVARAAGFPRPLLHGLCTYGFVCRAVLRSFCGFDPSRIAEFDARFSAPFFPGETLRIEMWRDGQVVSFRARCAERDSVVLDNGRAVLKAV